MSIWTDCEQYDAYPFYGFPVKPSFKGGIISLEFPLGYAPNGSQTGKIAHKMKALFGGEIIEVTDRVVRISVNEQTLSRCLLQYYLAVDVQRIDPKSITV